MLNRKKLSIGILVIFAVILAAFSSSTNSYTSIVKNTISRLAKSKPGEIKITGCDTSLPGIIAEDNTYQYKVNLNSYKIDSILAKDGSTIDIELSKTEGFNFDRCITEDQAIAKAWKYLEQYEPVTKNCKYLLDYCKEMINGNYYEINFEEYAPNGIRTGRGVGLNVDILGDMLELAQHEGNAYVAENTKPKLSRNSALEMTSSIMKREGFLEKDISKPSAYLTTWDSRLVWYIAYEGGSAESCFFRTFFIDAVTGVVLEEWK